MKLYFSRYKQSNFKLDGSINILLRDMLGVQHHVSWETRTRLFASIAAYKSLQRRLKKTRKKQEKTFIWPKCDEILNHSIYFKLYAPCTTTYKSMCLTSFSTHSSAKKHQHLQCSRLQAHVSFLPYEKWSDFCCLQIL